jgi:predicted phosphohydrolase
MTEIFYLSDLHLEFYKNDIDFNTLFDIKKFHGKVLCLCGDIGFPEEETYGNFIDFVTKLFKYVFVISGNHEYYSVKRTVKTIDETDNLIEEICGKYDNVFFLNNKMHFIEEYNLHIIGSPLWTDVDKNLKQYELYSYNDFSKIYSNKDTKLNLQYLDDMHIQSKDFIIESLENIKDLNSNVIIMTHHMPSYQLINDKYKNFKLNSLFASNLDDLIEKYKINYWLCGHSHMSNKIKINNTQLMLNPVGYPGENFKPKYFDYITI